MSTPAIHPIRGSTAFSVTSGPRGPARTGVGDVLRAVGVFLDTAFRVVVLGSDGTPRRNPAENGYRGPTGTMR